MKIKTLIPNFITSLNLICGCLAIGFAMTGRMEQASYLIFLGAVFDFFDGFVARLLNVKSAFGKELDSLADLITFGVAPGVILFTLIYPGYVAKDLEFVAFIAFLFPLCAGLRLAKFNTDSNQTHYFVGMPSPAAGIFVASLPLVCKQAVESLRVIDIKMNHIILNNEWLTIIFVVVSLLMIVPLPLMALKFQNFKLKDNLFRYLFLISSLVLLIIFYWASVPMIILLYVLVSLIANPKKEAHEIQS
ncbi:MAG: CDP-diacylglycerol--serine O-phosphatidyltransferase [Bacteroidota bacterium]